MRVFLNILLAAVVLSCGGMLWLSVVPGRVGPVVIWLAAALLLPIWLPVAVISCLDKWPLITLSVLLVLWNVVPIASMHWWRKLRSRPLRTRQHYPRRRLVGAAVLLGVTALLLAVQAPTRAGFALSRSSFEPLTTNMTATTPQVSAVDARIGIYRVRAVGVDPRGGVYFMLNQTTGSLSWRTTSYGFAHQPNPQGTPFGDQHYRFTHLGGGWYAFRASKAS